MARYKPKPNPFLTPQMTAGVMSALQGPATEKLERLRDAATAFAWVTDGKYQYDTYFDSQFYTFGGGPRVGIQVGIAGPYLHAIEYGSPSFPRSGYVRGMIRSALGG